MGHATSRKASPSLAVSSLPSQSLTVEQNIHTHMNSHKLPSTRTCYTCSCHISLLVHCTLHVLSFYMLLAGLLGPPAAPTLHRCTCLRALLPGVTSTLRSGMQQAAPSTWLHHLTDCRFLCRQVSWQRPSNLLPVIMPPTAHRRLHLLLQAWLCLSPHAAGQTHRCNRHKQVLNPAAAAAPLPLAFM